MDKRTFLKSSSLLLGGALLSPLEACESPTSKEKTAQTGPEPLHNWAGNVEYSTRQVHYPKTLEEVQAVVKKCDTLKALGSRHSFNRIADSSGNQVSLQAMNKVVSLDKKANTVTVEGGARYGEFVASLHENGYALPNLASLPHITVIGACATATHGSGVKNGNLATAVSGLEWVNAAGQVVTVSKHQDGEAFYGAVVGLGALGVVTKVTLDLLPTFEMKQVVYRNLPMQELQHNFDALQARGYSVSLFTDWKNQNINEVWIKSRVDQGAVSADLDLYGAKRATQNLHPVEDQSAENVTEQLGKPGPWYERMPHFKMGFNPSVGKELQSEYFVPLEHAYEAMMAIEKLHEKLSPHLFISEIRTIQADNFWMSPCYKKTCVAFHTTWKPDMETVRGLLPLMEAQLAPFDPVPHWAKLFTMSPAVLQAKYEKLPEFKQLVAQQDPKGKFRNAFINKYLYMG
ncbi:FAD-binding protein [Hymenobacter sp. BT491]|uniref:FAD-binding protein n=1 Tax=Hymenobacter sp. BT491 TaxID=2766779 RepID=UPI001653ED50|nr:FAD-binding protein [Hymenobacter sp. BT491]MBC6992333.1 FAD-binding protein [Hymenobacter sp. BT491]